MPRQDIIERTITIDSPIDRVWDALTVAEHLAAWFGDLAEIDLRPGGAMKVGWTEYREEIACVVERVEYPTSFSFAWDAGVDENGSSWSTLVEFTLDESEGRTTVTVVESGLAVLPDSLYDRTLESNTTGWKAEFEDLIQYVTALATR